MGSKDSTVEDVAEVSGAALRELPAPILVILAIFCLVFAALASGLTLGLMSLDSLSLDVLSRSGSEHSAQLASRIRPLREHGNRLLVTLLISNALAAELLPLVLDSLIPGGGLTSIISSVLLIMFFSEIAPQAACSRYALEIGATCAPIVNILLWILTPVALPLAWILDKLLGGHEMGRLYTRDELKGLVEVHARSKYGMLSQDETTILKATLDFATKTVESCMTSAENIFMLDIESELNRDTMKKLLRSGHSRIPIYEGTRNNIVALLITKQLLLVDPDDCIPVKMLLMRGNTTALGAKYSADSIRVAAPLCVSRLTSLIDLLNEFQRGRSHMAMVFDDLMSVEENERKLVGLVTLEDVIEEILSEEIIDETDVYVNNEGMVPVYRRGKDGKLHRTLKRPENMEHAKPDGKSSVSSGVMFKYRSLKRSMDEEDFAEFVGKVSCGKIERNFEPVGLDIDEESDDSDDDYDDEFMNRDLYSALHTRRKSEMRAPVRYVSKEQIEGGENETKSDEKENFEMAKTYMLTLANELKTEESSEVNEVLENQSSRPQSDTNFVFIRDRPSELSFSGVLDTDDPNALMNDDEPQTAPVHLRYHTLE
uniref:CNNM transmembrane domain-containing protein n=1 Tax=Timspurckia oligopyrenoides TaxID=708627 RepID=A0A7S1EPL1_9RHOD